MKQAKPIVLTTVLFAACISLTARAGGVSGKVVDRDGAPLVGVSVVTDVAGKGTQTGPDGRFRLEVPDGVTRVTFSTVGYQPRQYKMHQVPESVTLEMMYFEVGGVRVTADRAERGIDAIAFDNVSRDQIERDFTVSEFPLLLQSTPNLYAYTDGGAPLGYSYLSIRGFDDKRVATYINGVPLNDPEDHNTYFVDLPDFAANVSDVQVQRGVGNSLYGDASFGGSINIVSSVFDRTRGAKLTTGYGEFTKEGSFFGRGISKQSLEYASGLVEGRWAFYGRFSRQSTGGYRDNSWYNGWSYYLTAGRLDHKMVTEFHVYGGPIRMHLAYYGVARDIIDTNRTFNPLGYANETDNFNQPHYHVHNRYFIDDRTTLSNSLYYIRGKGFYEQFKEGRAYADYNLTSASDSATGDLVRRKSVEKNQIGWNPRLDVRHKRGQHSIGGSFYYFESEHWGQVVSAQFLDQAIDPTRLYYSHQGTKYVASVFAQERYHLTEELTGQATAQLRYSKYSFEQERMGAFLGYGFEIDYLFLSPRLGLNYAISDGLDVFGNFGLSSRAPNDENIYDADDPAKFPQLDIAANYGDTLFEFGDATVKSECVYDLEMGASMRREQYNVALTLFWNRYDNENVFEGRRDEFGREIAINIDRAIHAGVELSGTAEAGNSVAIQASLAVNYNRIKEFDGILDSLDANWDWAGSAVRDVFDNKVVPGFPESLGQINAEIKYGRLRIMARNTFVGKRYMDLNNDEDMAIEPHYVASVSASYAMPSLLDIGTLTAAVYVKNLFDQKHIAGGYGGNYISNDGTLGAWAEYFVGAERSFYGQLSLELF